MFFLAVLTWATLTKEPPRIVKAFTTLDACFSEAAKENAGWPPSGPGAQVAKVRFVCLEVRGDA